MHSSLPACIGQFEIDCPEFVYHMYMPIKMADGFDVRIPKHLACFWPLVQQVIFCSAYANKYIYLTVKKMYIASGQSANRPGWHLDGYGTDDFNFIWSDTLSTEFVTGEFSLSADHETSLGQMQQQAEGRAIHTFPDSSLLWLDPTNVHRVAACKADCLRTFVKISASSARYNLAGNAHNYLFDYDWPMAERKASRNHPIAYAEAA